MNGSPCSSCGIVRRPAEDTGGRLYLWFPHPSGFRAAAEALATAGVPFFEADGDATQLVAEVPAGSLATTITAVTDALTGEERRAVRAVVVSGEFTPRDVAAVQPIEDLGVTLASGWLSDLLAEGRIESHAQPIVTPDGILHGHEMLARGVGADGALVPPRELYATAAHSGMLFALDRAARIRAVQDAAAYGLEGRVFINFVPTAIYNPAVCLQTTIAAVREAGIPPERVVFEVTETEGVRDHRHLASILDFYRGAGFKVALDDLGEGYSSLNLLHQVRPDYIKIDQAIIRGVDSDPWKQAIAEMLLTVAHRLDILTIAEGIETPSEAAWLAAHGTDYHQGFLYGRPGRHAPAAAPSTARGDGLARAA
ncbi:MAG: EAL domain-containing protein [Dehalococcoidia bacterium]